MVDTEILYQARTIMPGRHYFARKGLFWKPAIVLQVRNILPGKDYSARK